MSIVSVKVNWKIVWTQKNFTFVYDDVFIGWLRFNLSAVKNDKIISRAGVIENDFHNRKDLTPNICAVYVEEEYRCKGIAGQLLNFIYDDINNMGIKTLYLVTDHISFYDKYGWKFLCMVQEDGEPYMLRMYVHNI